MKRILTCFLGTLFCATTVFSAPLCDEFSSPDTMPKKYKKLAPVLSGHPSDWIIPVDQMDKDYVPSVEAAALLSLIVDEFESRGSRLAIMMPPPRPIIAGQAVINELSKGASDFDVDAVTASFNTMIEIVRSSGAIAPNLLELANRDEEIRKAYYYRHDTHWTPRGAMESATALAHAVIASNIGTFTGMVPEKPHWASGQEFTERGSLADMSKAVCGVSVPPITTVLPKFNDAGVGLLDEQQGRPRILLAGSSFSNRYKKDAYRVADAIAGTLNADVSNYSVSGGGPIGAIEGVVHAGLLDAENPFDLVVWELPYTEGLQSVGFLRQLLGALRYESSKDAMTTIALDRSGQTKIKLTDANARLIAIELPNTTLQRMKVDLRFQDGSEQTLGLVRKKHVPAELKSNVWAISLDALQGRVLSSVTMRYDASAIETGSTVLMY